MCHLKFAQLKHEMNGVFASNNKKKEKTNKNRQPTTIVSIHLKNPKMCKSLDVTPY